MLVLVVCVECSSLSGLTQNYKIFYDLNDRLTFLTFKHPLLDQQTLCVCRSRHNSKGMKHGFISPRRTLTRSNGGRWRGSVSMLMH